MESQLIRQMIRLGENHMDIKNCLRFFNEQIASMPIFDEPDILDEVFIWLMIYIF